MIKRKMRKCAIKGCPERFMPRSITHKCCSQPCAEILATSMREIKERKETSIRREKLKTKSDYTKEAQVSFNKYIRLRAIRFKHACISSGRILSLNGVGGGFDCGHFRPVGSAKHLRFNMNNAWGQCKQDNLYGAGAYTEYRKGLIDRRGIEIVDSLENDNRIVKFTDEYLIRIKKIFDKKSRRMKKRIDLLAL